jgi:uncharacterized membrane protein YeaQ/YmgE (transglycosylase-associated protein family)
MSWIIVIIVGAIIGWLASLIMHTDAQQGLFWNIIIGIVGALLGQWVFGTLLKIGTAASAGSFSFYGILWGVIGAVILIAILKALHVLK